MFSSGKTGVKRRAQKLREVGCEYFKLLKTKRRQLYLKTRSVPRSKHFPPRL